MTYDEFIANIIDLRGQGGINPDKYKEQHHIIPVCLGGGGDDSKNRFYKNSHHPNCIGLYPQEHFIAHKLLVEQYPDNNSLWWAGAMMAFPKTNLQQRTYVINAEEYALLKNKLHEIQTGQPLSEVTRDKVSKALKNFYSIPENRQMIIASSTTKKSVYCIDTKQQFNSISEAARYFGLKHSSSISTAIIHKCKAAGYYWCYNNLEDITNMKQYLQEHKAYSKGPMSTELKQIHSTSCKAKKKIICIETQIVYSSVKNAMQTLNIGTQIFRCLKNQQLTAGGYHGKYIEEKENE